MCSTFGRRRRDRAGRGPPPVWPPPPAGRSPAAAPAPRDRRRPTGVGPSPHASGRRSAGTGSPRHGVRLPSDAKGTLTVECVLVLCPRAPVTLIVARPSPGCKVSAAWESVPRPESTACEDDGAPRLESEALQERASPSPPSGNAVWPKEPSWKMLGFGLY